MPDHSEPDDELPDPVEQMNADEERQLDELLALDRLLDEMQEKLERQLERLWHTDALGMTAFGDRPGWIDRRLGE
jgi:hypothetical protein